MSAKNEYNKRAAACGATRKEVSQVTKMLLNAWNTMDRNTLCVLLYSQT